MALPAFICVGFAGSVGTSDDGITWTAQDSDNTATWDQVLYAGAETFVCVSADPYDIGVLHDTDSATMISLDGGVSWTTYAQSFGTQFGTAFPLFAGGFDSFAFNGTDLYVAIVYSAPPETSAVIAELWTSPDAITWTLHPAPFLIPTQRVLLRYDAQTANFIDAEVVTGATSGATGTIGGQTDLGVTGVLDLDAVAGTFLDNELITSATGSATANGTQISLLRMTHIIWDGARFVCLSQYDLSLADPANSDVMHFLTSTDGINWSIAGSVPDLAPDNLVWNGLRFANERYMCGGQMANYSSDLVSWASVALPEPAGVVYWWATDFGGNDEWVLVNAGGEFSSCYRSTDNGATWASQAAPTPVNVFQVWEDVAYNEDLDLYVAIGYNDDDLITQFMTSPDGVTWTYQDNTIPDGYMNSIISTAEEPDPPPEPEPDPDYPPDHVPYPGRYAWASAAPLDGTTWLYDGSTGFWSMLKSEQISRHRVQISFQVAGQTIGCDYFNGKLYRITDQAYSDNGKMIEGEIIGETLTMGPDEAFLTVNKLRVGMEVGVGNTVAPGDNPQVALSIARDSGAKDFGPEMWKPLGQTGEVYTRLEWRRLGTTRYFTAKLRITDPVKRVITGASVNPED